MIHQTNKKKRYLVNETKMHRVVHINQNIVCKNHTTTEGLTMKIQHQQKKHKKRPQIWNPWYGIWKMSGSTWAMENGPHQRTPSWKVHRHLKENPSGFTSRDANMRKISSFTSRCWKKGTLINGGPGGQ